MANIASGKVQFNVSSAKDFRATMAIWHVFDFECKDYAKKYAFDRLNRILGKQIDEVSFPMGMRPWKINTRK